MSGHTTLLGIRYPGKPMFGTLALRLHHMEQSGDAKGAQALLDAHNKIAAAFKDEPVDLASQFTTASPMSMSTRLPKALAIAERDIDRVVTRTVRAA